MILTYRYRLLPTKRQHKALCEILETQRILYNAALEERIDAWQKERKSISYNGQCKSVTEWRRSDPDSALIPANLQRWTLRRLDDTFGAFFRRMRTRKGKAGFPRFRSRGRWRSFGFAEFSGIKLEGRRLRFKGMPGGLRIHLHRELPVDIRSCAITRDHKGWVIGFQCRMEASEKRCVRTTIAIDLGLSVFSYASDGVVVPTPRIAHRAKNDLRRRQRALARCERGSNRRKKIKQQVTRLHAKIVNARSTWLHQQSAALLNRADLVVAEDLQVTNLIKNPYLASSIGDAGWAKFLSMVKYKAERAGARFIAVDPRNTSQSCSGCGEKVPKSLKMRIHSCPHCGLVMDRDHNASLNILAAVVGRGASNVTRWSERRLGNISSKETSN